MTVLGRLKIFLRSFPADLRFTGSGVGLTCQATFDAIQLLDPAKMAVIYLDQLAL